MNKLPVYPSPDSRPIRVLLVEDNPADARLIQEMLNESSRWTYAAECVDCLTAALERISGGGFDIILLDLSLPDSQGLHTLEQMESKTPDIPVIVLTGIEDESLTTGAVYKGAQDYLVKGQVDGNLLTRAVHYAIERKKADREIRESREKARAISDSSKDAIIVIDGKGVISYFNHAAERIFGFHRDEALGNKLHSFLVSEDARKEYYKKLPGFDKTGQCMVIGKTLEVLATRKDGTRFPVELSISSFQIKGEWHSVGTIRDITERKKAEEKLRQSEKRFRDIAEHAQEWIWEVDARGKYTYTSPLVKKLLGYNPEEVLEKHFYDLFHPEDRERLKKAAFDVFKAKQPFHAFVNRNVHKDGRIVWLSTSGIPLFSKDGGLIGYRGVDTDITERKKMEEKLQEEAITDDLTGLLNRRGFFTLAAQQRKVAVRAKRGMSLLFFDMDNMKEINDRCGHMAGDQALIDTADILSRSLRESDIIARIGGDEFAALLTELSDPHVEEIIIHHLKHNVHVHNKISSRAYKLSFSIGSAHFDPDQPCSIDDLLNRADELMYENKKNRFKKEIMSSRKGEKTERRKYERIGADIRCTVEFASVSSRVVIKNISEGGMCLKTSQQIPANNIHRVKIFSHDNKEISCKGKVIWSTPMGAEANGAETSLTYETGLQFIELSEGKKQSLGSTITSLSSLLQTDPDVK